jgi:hypothetical protein
MRRFVLWKLAQTIDGIRDVLHVTKEYLTRKTREAHSLSHRHTVATMTSNRMSR